MKNSVPKTTNRELRLIILEEKDYAIEMLVFITGPLERRVDSK